MANRFNFRVWDKKNEKMVYPNGNGYFNLKNDTVIDGNGELFDLVCQETVEDCILMQSTGLVDKNGKEVFEGDVIEYKGMIADVIYCEDEAKFIIKYKNDFLCIEDCDVGYMTTYEIIGNIYENEELLK